MGNFASDYKRDWRTGIVTKRGSGRGEEATFSLWRGHRGTFGDKGSPVSTPELGRSGGKGSLQRNPTRTEMRIKHERMLYLSKYGPARRKNAAKKRGK